MGNPTHGQPVTRIIRALVALDEPAANVLATNCWQRLEPHHGHEHYEVAEAAAVAVVEKLRLVDPGPPVWSGVVVWWGGGVACTQIDPVRGGPGSPTADPWWAALALEREWLWCELVEASGFPRELGTVAASIINEVSGGSGEVRDLLRRMSIEPSA
jgi:hypothetical protein